MTAAQRLAALDSLPAIDLVAFAEGTLRALVEIMNNETTLLRAGRLREATALTADKTRLAQDYVSYSRAIQRELPRLKRDAPNEVARLRSGHEQLATQMAENLKVIATARDVTDDLLSDVSVAVGKATRAKTYGASGQMTTARPDAGNGIAINRAL